MIINHSYVSFSTSFILLLFFIPFIVLPSYTSAQVYISSPGTPWLHTGAFLATYTQNNLCWDAQSFAEGARLQLNPCNDVSSFTQIFSMTQPASGGNTLILNRTITGNGDGTGTGNIGTPMVFLCAELTNAGVVEVSTKSYV
jgi:hypothetical protein